MYHYRTKRFGPAVLELGSTRYLIFLQTAVFFMERKLLNTKGFDVLKSKRKSKPSILQALHTVFHFRSSHRLSLFLNYSNWFSVFVCVCVIFQN